MSPREREDEQRRHRDEFDLEYEDFWAYMARLSERGNQRVSAVPPAGEMQVEPDSLPRSEIRDEEAA